MSDMSDFSATASTVNDDMVEHGDAPTVSIDTAQVIRAANQPRTHISRIAAHVPARTPVADTHMMNVHASTLPYEPMHHQSYANTHGIIDDEANTITFSYPRKRVPDNAIYIILIILGVILIIGVAFAFGVIYGLAL